MCLILHVLVSVFDCTHRLDSLSWIIHSVIAMTQRLLKRPT